MKITADTKGHWVTRYARGITILGVMIALGGVAYFVMMAYGLSNLSSRSGALFWMFFWGTLFGSVRLFVIGFLTIAISQLLVYTIGPSVTPGRVLRMASGLLFLMAGLSIAGATAQVVSIYMAMSDPSYIHGSWFTERIWNGAWPLLSGLGAALFCVALGFTLRRVLPVIEESKGVV